MQSILTTSNLTTQISPALRLGSFNFSLHSGEAIAVIGPNGAGKTSLLRLLSNELPALHGEVRLHDRPVSEWPEMQRARLMAVLPQYSQLDFPFTVQEVVMLGRTPHETSRARNQEIVAAALEKLDCKQLAQRFYVTLSGGEKQLVQLARILSQIWDATESDEQLRPCLLLDEPCAALDLAHQEVIVELVRSLTRMQVGVVIVLHDLGVVSRCADRVLLLEHGSAACLGPLSEVMHEAVLEPVFRVKMKKIVNPLNGGPLVVT